MSAGYKLRINGGALVNSVIDVGNVLAHTYTGLDPSTTYNIEVKSYDGGGFESDWSPVVSATTDALPPSMPAIVIRDWDPATLSLANNDPIATITDSIGGIAAAQSTSGSRPLFKTAVLDGAPAMAFDGTDDFLDAGDDLDLLATSMTWFVVAKKAAGDAAFFAKSDNSTDGSYAGLQYTSGVGGVHTPAIYNAGSFLSGADSAFHLYEFRMSRSASPTGYLEVWKDGLYIANRVTFTADEATSKNTAFNFLIGKFTSGLPVPFSGQIARVLVARHTGEIPADDIHGIYTILNDAYPSLNVFNPDAIITFEGDSITRGHPDLGVSAFPHKYSVIINANSTLENTAGAGIRIDDYEATPDQTRTRLVRNVAFSGENIPQITTEGPVQVDPYFVTGATNILVVCIGSNDVLGGLGGVPTMETDLQAYFDARRAANPSMILVACTIPDRVSCTAAVDAFNAWIMANYTTFADYVIDFHSVVPDSSDLTLFQTDGAHQTDAARVLMTGLVDDVITPLL